MRRHFEVIIRPEAEEDLKAAFDWYEDAREGLGHDFLLQIEASINIISRNPNINPVDYKETRKHLINRFPYKLIYLVSSHRIIVLAVLHEKRNPELTKQRIDNS